MEKFLICLVEARFKMKAKHRQGQLLIWLGSVLLLSLLGVSLLQPWTHTLAANGHWESTKVGLKRGVLGGVAFVMTPLGLYGNKLNLGAWHGFQEVYFRKELLPKQVQFQLEVPEGSYFYFLFNKTHEGFSGIRLSRNSDYPSLYFRADPKGEFSTTKEISSPPWKEIPQKVTAVFAEHQVQISLGNEVIGTFNEALAPKQQLGFRAGSQPAYVDHVLILSQDNPKPFQEDFSSPANFWQLFFVSLLLVLFFNALLFIRKRHLHYFLAFNLILIFLAIPLTLTNRYFLARNYLANKIQFLVLTWLENYPSHIESKSEVLERVHQELNRKPSTSPQKILFIGTSQTWGAGAQEPEDTFVSLLEKKLNQTPPERSFRFVNAGISGARSYQLLELYQKEWIRWNPDWVAINLSNNDQDSKRFHEALEGFLSLNEKRGIKTVLILEPNSPEQIRQNLFQNHEILWRLSQKYRVPTIDLHHCLSRDNNKGLLWWDFVHLTNLGQEKAAECLLEPLKLVTNESFHFLSQEPLLSRLPPK